MLDGDGYLNSKLILYNFQIVPWGFRKALNWVRITYNNPRVLITENGISLERGLHDHKRVQYISSYLTSLLEALKDGCRVLGYAYWSFLDNFEWMRGYSWVILNVSFYYVSRRLYFKGALHPSVILIRLIFCIKICSLTTSLSIYLYNA